MSEPVWITDLVAVALNHRMIHRFGGLAGGPRDQNLLRAALARPLNKWHYDDPQPDLFALAAAYGFAITRGRVFVDGNKRTAHALPAIFLASNGVEHRAPEDEVVAVMVALADGKLSENELGSWLRQSSRRRA